MKKRATCVAAYVLIILVVVVANILDLVDAEDERNCIEDLGLKKGTKVPLTYAECLACNTKPAEKALFDSGAAWSTVAAVPTILGFMFGIDVAPMMFHLQWSANIVNFGSMDHNITACMINNFATLWASGGASCDTGDTDKQKSVLCPGSVIENRHRIWASNFRKFNFYFNFDTTPTCTTNIIDEIIYDPKKYRGQDNIEGNVSSSLVVKKGMCEVGRPFDVNNPFTYEYKMNQLTSCLVISGSMFAVVAIAHAIMWVMTKQEHVVYDEAYKGLAKQGSHGELENVGPPRCLCSKRYPQDKLPCFPLRYWFPFPAVELRLWYIVYYPLTFASFSAIAGGAEDPKGRSTLTIMGVCVFCLLCLPLPILATWRILTGIKRDGRSRLEKNDSGIVGWRDPDGGVFVKTWRTSTFTNGWGPIWTKYKEKRYYWGSIDMLIVTIETALIANVFQIHNFIPNSETVRATGIIVCIIIVMNFIYFCVLILARPYYDWVKLIQHILHLAFRIFACMITTLYAQKCSDCPAETKQSIIDFGTLLSISTDGTEALLITLTSVMTAFMILLIFAPLMSKCGRLHRVWKSNKFWDTETEEYYRNNAARAKPKEEQVSKTDDSAIPFMLRNIMKKNGMDGEDDSKNDPNAEADSKDEAPNSSAARASIGSQESAGSSRGVEMSVTRSSLDESLPPKWAAVNDPTSGKVYYYHVETNEVQWTKPTA